MRRRVAVLVTFVLFMMEAALGQSSCTSPANAIVAEKLQCWHYWLASRWSRGSYNPGICHGYQC